MYGDADESVSEVWKPKVGDKIYIVDNISCGRHPGEDRLLSPGDIVEIYDINSDNTISYLTNDGGFQVLTRSDFRKATNEELGVKMSLNCECNIFTLMAVGCKCGVFEREKNKL